MPINIKKEDLQKSIDNPKEGYVFLSFDPTGRLVSKDSSGNYSTIVPVINTGEFEDLKVSYLTVGYRQIGQESGLYSIGQGINVTASGASSFAQGESTIAQGQYSTAKGLNTKSSGDYSYVNGSSTHIFPLEAAGINSFIHSNATMSSGTVADYSVILGGSNHNIGSLSTNSIILGGQQNTISDNNTNVAVIACTSLTTGTLTDVVYVPRLILSNSSSPSLPTSTVDGTIEYNGFNFRGWKGGVGGSWYLLDQSPVAGTVTKAGSVAIDQIGIWNDSVGGVRGASSLTYNGTTLSVTGAFTASGIITSLGGNSTNWNTSYSMRHSGVTIGTANGLSIVASSQVLSLQTASGSQAGALSSSNWTTFNNKLDKAGGTMTGELLISTNGSTFHPAHGDCLTVTTGHDWGYAAVFINSGNTGGSKGLCIYCSDNPITTGAVAIDFKNNSSNSNGAIQLNNGAAPSFAAPSDERYKINIVDNTIDALNIIEQLKVKDFNFRKTDENGKPTNEYYNKLSTGFIAQSCLSIYPEMVSYNERDDIYSVSQGVLLPIYHKAIQELNTKIKSLEQRIFDLENPS